MTTTEIKQLVEAGWKSISRRFCIIARLPEGLGYAVHSLAYTRGCLASRPDALRAVSCTATLNRAVAELGHEIESAVRKAERIRPVDDAILIDFFAEMIRVLRTRDDVEISDEQIIERARQTTMAAKGEFEVIQRR